MTVFIRIAWENELKMVGLIRFIIRVMGNG